MIAQRASNFSHMFIFLLYKNFSVEKGNPFFISNIIHDFLNNVNSLFKKNSKNILFNFI